MLIICLFLVPESASAQFKLDIVEVADAAIPIAPLPTVEADEDVRRNGRIVFARRGEIHFAQDDWDRIVFRNETGDQARARLYKRLDATVNSINRACKLTQQQQEKLRLAGLGDMAMMFAVVAQTGTEVAGLQDARRLNQLLARARKAGTANPFGPTSFLHKVAATTLSYEQMDRYKNRGAVSWGSLYESAIRSTLAQIDRSLRPTHPTLTAEEKQRISKLLLQAAPSKPIGKHVSKFVLYQLFEHRDELHNILTKPRYLEMRGLIARGAAMQLVLQREGVIK